MSPKHTYISLRVCVYKWLRSNVDLNTDNRQIPLGHPSRTQRSLYRAGLGVILSKIHQSNIIVILIRVTFKVSLKIK